MKKNKIALLIASMMLVSGCSSSNKTVDGKSAVSSVNDSYVFADDLYDEIIQSSNGAQALYQIILQNIFEKECPVTKDMETEAKVTINTIKTNYSGQEDTLKSQLVKMGYNNLSEYKKAYIDYLQYTAFMNKYIDEHFDDIFEDYYTTCSPRKVSHILIKMSDPNNPTDEEKAKLEEVQKLLKEGKSFEDTAKDYSDDTTASNGGSLGLCDKNTSFVDEFKNAMLSMKEGEVSEPVKSDYGYHIIKIDSTNKDEIKEELSAEDSTLKDWSSDTFYDSYLEYVVFSSYDVQYEDDTVKNLVTDYVNNALEKRKAERSEG